MSTHGQVAVLAARTLRETRRAPTRVIFPLLVPIAQLVLFAAVFARVAQLPGYGARNSLDFLAPGAVAAAVVYGAGGAGFQMVRDIDTGFLYKLLGFPIRRSSIVAALLVGDFVRLAVHALVLVGVALALGARLATGPGGACVVAVLGGLFGACWSTISLNVALWTRDAEATGAANILVFPLYFGSTAFMPATLLPAWLRQVNRANPVAYLVNATRELMIDGWGWGAVTSGFIAAAVVGILGIAFGVAGFRHILNR